MSSKVRRALEEVGRRTGVCFRIVFADGSSYQSREGTPDTVITFHRKSAELNVLFFGHIGLLESYFAGGADIDGDIAAAFRAGMDAGFADCPGLMVRLRNRWHEWRFSNGSVAQAKVNARFHYGLGTEFFRYWLDSPTMTYTCAYWREGTATLEQAQRNKLDHVCRKLRLQPGESMADIGCGWGGLMFHAHEQFGVRATGYNTTTEQVAALSEEIRRRGLDDVLQVREADFREVRGQYDKCASVGVLEHAGRDQLPEAIRCLAECVKPGGLGVLHFIGHVGVSETEFFVRKHIFPGGWIPSLAQTIQLMERHGLDILDIENLRRHYALTLDEWAARFDRCWDDIRRLDSSRFNEEFYRKWRSYLYACAEMFRSPNTRTHLFQITFSKGNVGYEYPMSRNYLYAG